MFTCNICLYPEQHASLSYVKYTYSWCSYGFRCRSAWVDMGPSAIRLAKLSDTLKGLGHTITDLGNVEVAVPESVPNTTQLPYANVIAEACKQAYYCLKNLPEGAFPIILGGDHSISMGSVAGVSRGKRTGVLWIDAHTDLNTPEMALAETFTECP